MIDTLNKHTVPLMLRDGAKEGGGISSSGHDWAAGLDSGTTIADFSLSFFCSFSTSSLSPNVLSRRVSSVVCQNNGRWRAMEGVGKRERETGRERAKISSTV